jgi:hypothetical protein
MTDEEKVIIESQKITEIFKHLLECEDYLIILMELYTKERKGILFMLINSTMNAMQLVSNEMFHSPDRSLDLIIGIKKSIAGFDKFNSESS